MATIIKCPNCSFEFPLEDALNDELKENIEKEKQSLRQQMLDYKKMKEDELYKKEEEFSRQKQLQEEAFRTRLDEELKKKNQQLEESIRKSLSADYDNQLKFLHQSIADNEEKLKEARKKEFEFLQKEQGLKNREAELEIEIQRKLLGQRELLKERIQKEEEERRQIKETQYQLQLKELQTQLDDQKKLVDEMKRKQEQGSMQLQGEVQELLLEEILRSTFPFDEIKEVGKGVRGADSIQTVRNRFGNDVGKIIYESKRTKDFSAEWIEKLKTDMRNLGADVAVIVTQVLPKDLERFGEKDGVYICTFAEVRSVAALLRDAILKIYDARKSQENKGDKMSMLYGYLIGGEFGEQWKAIREGFLAMKFSIQKERDAMERLWKAREKQLEKVLLNAAHIKGSIEGIAGADAVNLNLLEDNDTGLLE
jgi:hypothetical protein